MRKSKRLRSVDDLMTLMNHFIGEFSLTKNREEFIGTLNYEVFREICGHSWDKRDFIHKKLMNFEQAITLCWTENRVKIQEKQDDTPIN